MRIHVVDPKVHLEAYRQPRQSVRRRLKYSKRKKKMNNKFNKYCPENHAYQYVNMIRKNTNLCQNAKHASHTDLANSNNGHFIDGFGIALCNFRK